MNLNSGITTNKVRELLDLARADSLTAIPDNAGPETFFMERASNHGVWQMFYRALIALGDYEIGKDGDPHDHAGAGD